MLYVIWIFLDNVYLKLFDQWQKSTLNFLLGEQIKNLKSLLNFLTLHHFNYKKHDFFHYTT